MHDFSRSPWSAHALLLLVACVLLASCHGASPLHQTGREAPPPRPNLSVDLVEHAPAQIEPQIDWRGARAERAPMQLTAGDGSGLRLVSLTGSVVVEDPLAFTELHLTFENPEPRRREGRFEFELPNDAALSRLAMRIGKRWMEGEVVERSVGRRTFETYVHDRPRVDPALLETAGANRVSARVFPILPRERKQIIVSYSQPLEGGDGSLRLPLSGLPELDVLDLRVLVKTADAGGLGSAGLGGLGAGELGQRVLEVRERDFTPTGDLVVDLRGAGEAGALRAEQLVAVRVRPQLPDHASDEAIEALTVLFDTSASTARGFDDEVDRLGAMLETLGDAPVRVLAFDQVVEEIHDGPASAALGAPLAGLRERRAFGASDLHGALSHALLREAASGRLLIWSDGLATAGELEPALITSAAASLGFERVDAYASSTSSDRGLLASLAGAGQRPGFVIGPDLPGGALLTALAQASFGEIELSIEGADWSYPRTLEGLAPGDDLVVYASFPDEAPAAVHVAFSDPRLPAHLVPTLEGEVPLVLRAVARARVDELQALLDDERDPAEAEQLRRRLVDAAIDNRLLTKHTALLVLESEAEFQRYGVRRSARADILTAGPSGVELLRRGAGPSGLPPSQPAVSAWGGSASVGGLRGSPAEEARVAGVLGVQAQQWGAGLVDVGELEAMGQLVGVGDLGLVGTGRGGGGTGEGTIGLGGGGIGEGTIGLGPTGLIGKGAGGGTGSGYGRGSSSGFGGRGMRVPKVRQAKAQVSGNLDRDIIRRVVRSHINELRAAYNAGLTRNPTLRGRVEIEFTITAAGTVGTARVKQSTLADRQVAEAVARAARRWKFPKPAGGGLVIVTYPFELEADGSVQGPAPQSSWGQRGRGQLGWGPAWRRPGEPSDQHGARWQGSAQSGRFGTITTLAAAGQLEAARADAWDWATTEPDNVLALLALAELLEREGDTELAGRVVGSLIDLHPERADMRRSAGVRLEALGPEQRALAIDSYAKAVEQRPDQINGHRLLAWALVQDRQHARAYEVLERALATDIPAGRFRGVKSLLREDRRLIAAAWLATTDDLAVIDRLERDGVEPADEPSLRLVASWETDATDVDILVDPLGPGSGRRHADVRTGFGPEAWIARGARRPEAVDARVRYFNRGAMGYALGAVTSVSHDGAGHLSFRERPFVLMNASGSVDLGRF